MKGTAFLLLLVMAPLGGCGSSSGGNPDGSTDGNQHACGAAQMMVTGTVAGDPYSAQATVAGQQISNAPSVDRQCYTDVYFIGGGRLSLEWPSTLAAGQTSAARGYLILEGEPPLNTGNCMSGLLESEITWGANGFEFVLRALHQAPYCSGAPVEGEVSGCATFK
jgi:hypothetical protein